MTNAMNCENCGAPMALVREHDYFHCDYCGAFRFEKTSQEDVRVIGPDTAGLGCPLCGEPLALATYAERYQSNQCRKCRGILFQRPVFAGAVEEQRSVAAGPGMPPAAFAPQELRRRLRCPRCAAAMDTHEYLGPGAVVVDTCDACDLIWLDHGELRKIIAAPGSDRRTGALPAVPREPAPAYAWAASGAAADQEDAASAAPGGLLGLLERFLAG
jgi:Zn-finger nucleic acid-binding protein/DNA-directed RNA polymerase subunit RPC12/RpoP